MKQKILFTASIAKHILRFHLPYLEWFQSKGYETHVACEGSEVIPFVDKQWSLPFVRTPFSFGHFGTYKSLRKIMDEERFVLVHCHTPMASVVTRLAGVRSRKNGTKIIYTAHGFHFFNGAPFINWIIYYPIEILLSGLADTIVTINQEDFELISSKGNRKTKYRQIPGIGVEKKKFKPVNDTVKKKLRAGLGFSERDILLVYAAEFISRKNHRFLLEVMVKLNQTHSNVKLLLCGRGELLEQVLKLSNLLGLTNSNVFFLGFRNDINEIFQAVDIGVTCSQQEGLAINVIEEMMSGLPVLASGVRGHIEVVDHQINGFVYQNSDVNSFIDGLNFLLTENKNKKMNVHAVEKAKLFELKNSVGEMGKIYYELLPK